MPDSTELPASPLHALCVYAEPLVAGRRVVLLGDATRHLGERFLSLGARVVHLYDPQPARAAAVAGRSPRGLTVLPLPAGDFDVRDGAFDLAVILDLAELPAPAPLLARVRRLVGSEGAAIVRTRGSDGGTRARSGRSQSGGSLDYYDLYDLVAMQFAHVRMVGQIPWSGVALAELGREGEEPDVTVDTQLVTEVASAEAFIAVASHNDVRLAEYALVQVPLAPAVDIEATIAYGNERADLAAAQLRASLLEAQIEELRGQRNREAVTHTDGIAALEVELAERVEELQRADERTAEATLAAAHAKLELRAREEEVARLSDRAALALREQDDERRALGHELEKERRARTHAEQELGATRSKLEAVAHEAKAFESSLRRVPALEVALAQLEAGAAQNAERLAASETARALLERALVVALAEVEALRRASAEAHVRSHAEAEGKTDDEDEAARVVIFSSRVGELEAQVVGLEAEVTALSEGHGDELIALEAALRDRAKATHLLEQELARRERIILDLVHAFEEERAPANEAHREAAASAVEEAREHEAAAKLRGAQHRIERARTESAELVRKLDEAALEIARREAERETAAWRIQELEQQVARLEDEQSELTMTIPPPAFMNVEREANDVTVLQRRLAAIEDELDLVRQALAQEHEARARAESGEALTQARGELARQAALVEKLSRELEAHDGVRRPTDVAGDSTASTS